MGLASQSAAADTTPTNSASEFGDFNTQFSEWNKRSDHVQELLEQNRHGDARRIQRDEFIDSVVQEGSVRMSGGDPLHDIGATGALSPEVQTARRMRLIGEKLYKQDEVVKQNQQEIDWMLQTAKQGQDEFRNINKLKLSELRGMGPEGQSQVLAPVKIRESEAANIQQRLNKLDQSMKQVDRSFSVFTHPQTAAAAQALGLMTNPEQPQVYQQTKDAPKGFWTGTELEAHLGMMAYKLGSGVAEGGGALIGRGIDMAGLAGDAVLRAFAGEDRYNQLVDMAYRTTGFHPDFANGSENEFVDEMGNSVRVQKRFGLPEMVAPLGAFLLGQEARQFAENAREGEAIYDAYNHENGAFWGVAGDVAMAVGVWESMGLAARPLIGGAMGIKSAVAQGMAMVGAKTSARTAKIADVLGNGAAQAAGFGAYETLATGHTSGYAGAFARGAESGLAFWALGSMGRQAETLLMRKSMPAFVAKPIGTALEGLGFTVYGEGREALFGDHPAGIGLWQFLKDPTPESWNTFKGELTKNVTALALLRLARAGHASETRRAAGPKTVEEAAKPIQPGEAPPAEMLVDVAGGTHDTPSEAFDLARYHRELKPVAKEIGDSGRQEAEIGKARTEPEQLLPGSLSGRDGTYSVDATENLAERLIRFNRKSDARKIAGGGSSEGTGELGVVGTFLGGKMLFSAVKGGRGENASVDISAEAGRLAGKLQRRGFSPEQVDRAIEANTFTLHNHPDANALSAADMRNFIGRGGTNFVVTDRGMFVARVGEAPSVAPKAEMQGQIALAHKRKMMEAAKAQGLDYLSLDRAWNQNWSALKKGGSEQRKLGELGSKLYGEAATEVAKQYGLDVQYFGGKEATSRFGEFQKSGDVGVFGERRADPANKNANKIDPVSRSSKDPVVSEEEMAMLSEGSKDVGSVSEFKEGGPEMEATAPREGPAREPTIAVPRRRKGESVLSDTEIDALMGDDLLSSPTTEKKQALARAYKSGNLDRLFDVAHDQFGTEGMAKTPENAERLMAAAGLKTGQFVPSGAPDFAGWTSRTVVPDAELTRLTRNQGDLERKALEMEKEGAFNKGLNRLYDAEAFQEVAQRVREMGPSETLPESLRALAQAAEGRLEAPTGKEPSGPPPSDADAEVFLKAMFDRQSKMDAPSKSAYQRVKGLASRFAAAFKDREGTAQAIEKAGYRSKFKKLGADEEFATAETDRLQKDLDVSPRLSLADLESAFEPITLKEGTPEQRVLERKTVLEYAALRDQFDNRIRTHKEVIRDEQGSPLLDAQGKQQLRDVETENVLPGNLSPEQWQRALLQTEERLTPEGKQAYQNIRTTLDGAWQSMVDRGIARAEDKQKNYFPRRVVDYDSIIEGFGPSPSMLPKEPFRGFLKARTGSERMIEATPEALMGYLTKVRLTNAMHDYNVRVSRGIENRLLHELGTNREDLKDLTPQEWQELRARAEKNHDAVVVDVFRGHKGARTLQRDPVVLDAIAQIHEQTDMRIIPEVVEGRDLRPNAEEGRFLVTKPLVELFRKQREVSGWATHPVLRGLRKAIGKWFKGPALRGFGGLRTPSRNLRNLISDTTAVAFKDSLKAAAETARLIPEASPIAAALASRDPAVALAKLSPAAQSIARELDVHGTVQTGQFTSQAEGLRDQLGGEWLKRYMPETRQFLDSVSKLARADFKWARAIDDYGENLVRIAYFMRERMSALRDIELPRPGETRSEAATRAAHLQVSDVLINYKHLTPLEKFGLNGLMFPFYTWARYNTTKQLAELVRHPGNQLGKYAAYAGVIAAFNWMLSPDEESRYTQLRPEAAGKGHLFLPWIRDEFGNPLLLTWEDTFTSAGDFLGLSGLYNKLGAYLLGHGNEDLLLAELFPQGMQNAQRAFANATAPWVRSALDVGYRSKFQTIGERAETIERDVRKGFLPAADALRITGMGAKDEGVGAAGRAAQTFFPMLRFLDLSKGVPLSQANAQFEAGRIQRAHSQESSQIDKHMQRFLAGLKKGDASQMSKAVGFVWNEVGPTMTESGQSEAHLWARMMRASLHELKQQWIIEGGGSLPPKFLELSRTQQVELLMRLSK